MCDTNLYKRDRGTTVRENANVVPLLSPLISRPFVMTTVRENATVVPLLSPLLGP